MFLSASLKASSFVYKRTRKWLEFRKGQSDQISNENLVQLWFLPLNRNPLELIKCGPYNYKHREEPNFWQLFFGEVWQFSWSEVCKPLLLDGFSRKELWWLFCDETCIKRTRTGSDHHVLISCSVFSLNWEEIWPGLSTSLSLLEICAELIGRLCKAFLLLLIVITDQERSDY